MFTRVFYETYLNRFRWSEFSSFLVRGPCGLPVGKMEAFQRKLRLGEKAPSYFTRIFCWRKKNPPKSLPLELNNWNIFLFSRCFSWFLFHATFFELKSRLFLWSKMGALLLKQCDDWWLVQLVMMKLQRLRNCRFWSREPNPYEKRRGGPTFHTCHTIFDDFDGYSYRSFGSVVWCDFSHPLINAAASHSLSLCPAALSITGVDGFKLRRLRLDVPLEVRITG